ncbi:tripartite motif-containing protein 66 [Ambystoma mexicanum]|uniref:tripartite motif-containing protein 66 n=1 Tax=Ambystoma mexicanum TaxID=8296 RepID=UPI0037E99303
MDFAKVNSAMARSCFECKERKPAYSLCTNCNRWLCCSCTEEHRHGKETGNHFLSVHQMGSAGSESCSSGFCVFCPLHNQEAMKLFCETCDVLTCRACLLLEHKEHRFRHLDEALQNQRILLENITSQAEEKKLGMQAAAKQLEDRLFEVKHTHRKVENQIKMAKMVLINELNKRTNALLEQLERITSERRHRFEQQLQAIIILNRQLEHVQNFISWAVCSKNRLPFLYSKELIVFQMQRLLETSCNTDVGPPWKIRFSWEPSLWTKQLSHLGSIVTDSGQIPHADAPSYGNIQELQTSYYRGHHAPPPTTTSQMESMKTSPKFQPSVQCPTPVCCSHCHTSTPQMHKSSLAHHSLRHHQHYRQTPGIQQHQQQMTMQYNLQQGVKSERGMPPPLRLMQPWVAQQPPPEHDNSSFWLGKQQVQRHQMQPNTYPVCIVPPQDINHTNTGHSQLMHVQSSMEAPSVQMDLGHLQKLNANHFQLQQQQQHHHQQQHHQQQHQQQQQQQTSVQSESSHEQAMQQSLDIIHQQFELEQMQKGLELLLQSQPQNLQMNPSKQPQHVQQTIVGQINYIVRQPAPVHAQSQDEVQQAFDDPSTMTMNEGQTTDMVPQVNNIISSLTMSQTFGEEEASVLDPMDSHAPLLSSNQVTKRAASASIVGFSSPLDVESSPARLSRSVDPEMQAAACQTVAQSHGAPCSADLRAETAPSCGAAVISATDGLRAGPSDSLATGDALRADAKCKVETEDYSCADEALANESVAETLKAMNELVLPMQSMLDEPINLSIRRCLQPDSPPTTKASHTQAPAIKEPKDESESSYGLQTEDTAEMKNIEGMNRADTKEQKIPYVRVERLKLCAPDTGELPVFKVQPQKSEPEGSLTLLIEYGAQSTCMSIKVHPENNPSSSPPLLPPEPPQLSTVPALLNVKPEELSEKRKSAEFHSAHVSQPTGDYKHTSSTPNVKKSYFNDEANPIENEDFCAVCLNGGEMLCCDHCPKVFHLSCHVPALLSFPVGEWVCTLCRNLMNPEVEYDCDNVRSMRENAGKEDQMGLDIHDQRKCEKLVLSLYCSSLSLPFQEPVSPLARHYYQIIKKPMDLSIIRGKLQKMNIPHYATVEELVFDVRLMFWNCAKFNYPDSEVAEAGRNLQMFFEDKLSEVYPDKIFSFPLQEDSDSEEISGGQSSFYTRGFHWPSYELESSQPKRRRRHTVSYRAKESDSS